MNSNELLRTAMDDIQPLAERLAAHAVEALIDNVVTASIEPLDGVSPDANAEWIEYLQPYLVSRFLLEVSKLAKDERESHDATFWRRLRELEEREAQAELELRHPVSILRGEEDGA